MLVGLLLHRVEDERDAERQQRRLRPRRELGAAGEAHLAQAVVAADDDLHAGMGEGLCARDRVVPRAVVADDDDIRDVLFADFAECPLDRLRGAVGRHDDHDLALGGGD